MKKQTIVHALLLPAPIHDVTTCCGMPLSGASDEHRVTSDPESVTCDGCLTMMGKMRAHDWSPDGIPELRDIQIEDGEAKLKLSHKLVSVMAATFLEAMKDKGAVNYLEYVFDGAGLPYEEHVVVTVQRVAGKTPAQLKAEAEDHAARWKNEADRLRERLQFDPGGSDKIDELESAVDFLRHRAETAEAKVERLRDEVAHDVDGVVLDHVAVLRRERDEARAKLGKLGADTLDRYMRDTDALRAEIERLRKLVSHTTKTGCEPVICHTCKNMPDDCFPENNECPHYVPRFKV